MKTISDAKQQLEKSIKLIQELQFFNKHNSLTGKYLDEIQINVFSGIFALDVANSLLDLEQKEQKNKFDLIIKQAQINSQSTHNFAKVEFFVD